MAIVRRPTAFWEQLRDHRRKTVRLSTDLIAHARGVIRVSEERIDSSDRLLRERYPWRDERTPR